MRRIARWVGLVAIVFLLKGTNVMAADTDQVAVVETKFGKMVIEFYDKDAPKTTANFIKLAKEGYYNGTTFHRVIPGFMIQGGDPNSKSDDRGTHGMGGPGYTVEAEIKHDTSAARWPPHAPVVQAIQRSGRAAASFSSTSKRNDFLNGDYTVFGNVISGMDVADKIVGVARDPRDNPNDKVEMKVSITTRAEALKK